MADEFDAFPTSGDAPAVRSLPVVPHDTNLLASVPRAVHVGVAGTIVGQLKDDQQDRTFKNVPAGPCPYRFKLIKATGTTATDIVALY